MYNWIHAFNFHFVLQTSHNVLRLDDEGSTTSVGLNPLAAITIQHANQSSNVNRTNSSDGQTTNGKEPIVRTQSKKTNQADENTEPATKRLKTLAASDESNHHRNWDNYSQSLTKFCSYKISDQFFKKKILFVDSTIEGQTKRLKHVGQQCIVPEYVNIYIQKN